MFRMQRGEIILDLQKRFTHLRNHLMTIGKTFTNDGLNLKVLIYLTMEWQLKVTVISEKKSLSKMYLVALFGKIQEYELEHERLEKYEVQEKKPKSLTLKIRVKDHDSNQKDESQSTSDEDDALIQKFENLLRKERTNESSQKEAPKRKVACFEYGKRGYVKSEFPTL